LLGDPPRVSNLRMILVKKNSFSLIYDSAVL
jgi:hypothetical protein